MGHFNVMRYGDEIHKDCGKKSRRVNGISFKRVTATEFIHHIGPFWMSKFPQEFWIELLNPFSSHCPWSAS